jgi:hypothetical protein
MIDDSVERRAVADVVCCWLFVVCCCIYMAVVVVTVRVRRQGQVCSLWWSARKRLMAASCGSGGPELGWLFHSK